MTVGTYLEAQVLKDLGKKTVFVVGPRQVGETTLALAILGGGEGYLSWKYPRTGSAS